MSISVVIVSALQEKFPAESWDEVGQVAQDAVIDSLNDDAVRREVFESVRWELNEVSMLEVHKMLDSIVEVLKGNVDE